MNSVLNNGNLDHTVDVLARALLHDPVCRYLQLDTYGLPNSSRLDGGQSHRCYHGLVLSLQKEDGAILAQLQDGGAVSVW